MAFDETNSCQPSTGNSTHVPLLDIGRFLHHRTQMTFTENKLVGSDPSVGAAQTDPNLINPWGVSEMPTSPSGFPAVAGFASIYGVTSAGVTTNVIPPITIAVPPGQNARHGEPDRAGVQQFRFGRGLYPARRISGHLPVCYRRWDDLGLEHGGRHTIDHRGRRSE